MAKEKTQAELLNRAVINLFNWLTLSGAGDNPAMHGLWLNTLSTAIALARGIDTRQGVLAASTRREMARVLDRAINLVASLSWMDVDASKAYSDDLHALRIEISGD